MPDETSESPAIPEPNPNENQPPAPETTTPGGYSYTVVDDGAPAARGPAPARVGVHPLLLVATTVAAAVAAGAVVWFVAQGGGSGKSRLNGDVTNLLNAFSTGDGGTATTRYEGELAPGFPGDLPNYPGAKIVSSLAQVKGEDVSYLAIYDTSETRDKVVARFSEKLAADPWQIEGATDGRESALRQFSKIDDPNITGLVLVAQSKDEKTTTIFESVQVTSGAKDAKPPAYTAASARELPDGFPDSVPAYAGATLIESAYRKRTSGKAFAVSFVTKDDASGVLSFYRDKLSGSKLTVTDGDSSSSALEGAEAIAFADDQQTVAGSIVVGKFADDGSYTRIDVTVQVAKQQ